MQSRSEQHTSAVPRALRRRVFVGALLAFATFAASIAAFAIASGAVVSTANNGKFRQSILVNSQGRTLYVLSGETSHHLLCTSSACLAVWPPLTVSSHSVSEGAGVHGSLGVLKRGKELQVTLNGQPLYLFEGDSSRGQVNGEDIKTFGGTWHAVLSSGRAR
jgi:predicted lipoprotein with Yx(FWY)xxD motif